MALVVPTAGELKLLSWALVSTTTPPALTLKLYSNAHQPVASDTTANYTEATFTGYTAATLARASWTTVLRDVRAYLNALAQEYANGKRICCGQS